MDVTEELLFQFTDVMEQGNLTGAPAIWRHPCTPEDMANDSNPYSHCFPTNDNALYGVLYVVATALSFSGKCVLYVVATALSFSGKCGAKLDKSQLSSYPVRV